MPSPVADPVLRSHLIPLALVLLSWMPGGAAGAAPDRPSRANPAPGVTRPFCSTELDAWPSGRIATKSTPDAQFSLVTGLWVGAEVDRGAGPETIVSSAAYAFDFFPEGRSPGRDWFHFVQTDTATDVYPHEPLGIRVEQSILSTPRPGYSGHVRIRYVVENISASWRPPGWTLEHVYLGMFMDPDVGRTIVGSWSDDQAAFHSGRDGDLAYAFDELRGGGDDTIARVGLLLPRERVHVFRAWSFEADPRTDAEEYLLLRGDSHDWPTIDPPTTRASDQRILLGVGPASLAPGESRTFVVSLVCGDDLGSIREPGIASHGSGSVPGRLVVAPQVVDAGTPFVSFPGLAPGDRLVVHDVTGRRVTAFEAGAGGEARWELQRSGRRVAAGIYLVRVSTAEGVATGKIVVLR